MRLIIKYTVSESVEIPEEADSGIAQVIVEDVVEGAINYLQREGFEAKLKKIKRKS